MLFAIPFNALDSAGFWLRMWVVASSARIAHVLGIGVVVNGTQLLSLDGRYDYDVAAACSGVRSLVALAALSLLIGYLVFRPRFMWLLMFAVCFPLIFLGNVARIVSIIVAAQIGGQVWGDRAHEVMGFGVFAIVLGGVYGLAEYVGQKRPGWTNVGPNPASLERVAGSATHTQGEQKGFWLGATAVAISSAMLAAVLVHVVHMPANGLTGVTLAPDRINPVDLPTFIGNEWIGRRSEVTDFERQVLPPDTGFSRKIYVLLSDPTKQAFLSIVLSGRDRTSIHRPELCLVGQGWTIQSSFTHRFIYPGGNVTFPATVLRIDRQIKTANGMATVPQLFAYYFVGGDVVVASHWERIARDAWNRLAHGRSDRWAYVVVQTGESDGEAGALERIQAILEATTPYFQTANRN
jgi:exosortase/archaeosortase family protein